MISYVIPTRDRPQHLAVTLGAIDLLGEHEACGGAEVIVVDNASGEPVGLPPLLHNSGTPVKLIRLDENAGAAARNAAAAASDPSSDWLVMLDDDSSPDSLDFLPALRGAAPEIAAISADIHLARTSPKVAPPREQGGLPEVFIGCGVAVRRRVFLDLGGYDPAFHYYAEEYDLAARMLLAGLGVAFEPAFRVRHRKVSAGRDMNTIVSRLVRNNGWIAQRYAPESDRVPELRRVRRRYRAIAFKEHATDGYARGLVELRRTVRDQPRRPMPRDCWDRFTGLAAARSALRQEWTAAPFGSAVLVDEGKNAWAVRHALRELDVREVTTADRYDAIVIGTLSPGPMLDAVERWRNARPDCRVVAPWRIGERAQRAAA